MVPNILKVVKRLAGHYGVHIVNFTCSERHWGAGYASFKERKGETEDEDEEEGDGGGQQHIDIVDTFSTTTATLEILPEGISSSTSNTGKPVIIIRGMNPLTYQMQAAPTPFSGAWDPGALCWHPKSKNLTLATSLHYGIDLGTPGTYRATYACKSQHGISVCTQLMWRNI
jgi:hypothetical protein